ncbi:MAG: hypothetical protein OEU92_01760 [Alphaproteobacteria bacterium]|nr:hypothetical protein [Alphaproteobacteria bacterium]
MHGVGQRLATIRVVSLLGSACLALFASASSALAESVQLRFAVHDGFDRLVFDWPDAVGVDVKREGDQYFVAFERSAALDVSRLPTSFGQRLEAVGISLTQPSTIQLSLGNDTVAKTNSYSTDSGLFTLIVDVADRRTAPAQKPENVARPVAAAVEETAAASTPLSPEAKYMAAFDAMFADPDNPKTTFDFVEAAVAMGDVRGAISALERMLLVNPDLANIKLELGVLYRRVGADELAQSYITQALEAEDVPDDVRKRAESIQERTDASVAAARSPHKFGGSLFLGGRYETNANAGPKGTTVRVGGQEGPFLNDEDTEQEDVSLLGTASLNYAYDFGTQAGHALEARLFGLGSRYKDEADVSTTLIDAEIGPRFYLGEPLSPSAAVRPFVTGSHLELDDEQYRIAYGGGVNLRTGGDPLAFDLTLRYLHQHFQDTGQRPTASSQTGDYITLRPSVLIKPARGTLLGAGVIAGYNNADEDFESFIEAGANLFATQYFMQGLLTERPMSATLSGSYRRTEYDEPEAQIDPDTERNDDRYDLSLTFDVPIKDAFSFSLSGPRLRSVENGLESRSRIRTL